MRTPILLAMAFALSTLFAVSTAQAQERVALIIGNAAYDNAPALGNTINDATAMAGSFERLGFDVTLVTNQTHSDLLKGLNEFRQKASRSRTAVVFYAGHGIEVDKTNYLIPVDGSLKTDGDVEFESISLDLVLRAVEGASKLRMVILDACRNNPFLVRMERQVASRSIGRGLARVEPARNTLVAFAAREGTTASDGVGGDHSPFTEALLQHIEAPDLEINFLFRKVRDAVLAATGGAQEPFTYGSLSGEEFYLNDSGATVAGTPGNIGESSEDLLWAAVLRSGSLAGFERYLEQFPTGKFSKEAKVWIEVLQPKPDAVAESGGNDQLPAPGSKIDTAAVDPDPTIEIPSPTDDLIRAENPPINECDRVAADPSDDKRVTKGVDWKNLDAASAIKICTSARLGFPKAPRIAYQFARALQKAERYDEARPILEELVESDYAAAALLLGVMHGEGNGVTRDYSKAREFYQQAADANHPAAMGNLGLIYYRGNGVVRDFDQARDWFTRAAEAGSSEAMYNLAVIYGRGDGIKPNMSKAAEWMFEALARGNQSAFDAMAKNAGATTTQFRRLLQTRLRSAGYYKGSIDGRFGPGTKQAIAAIFKASAQ